MISCKSNGNHVLDGIVVDHAVQRDESRSCQHRSSVEGMTDDTHPYRQTMIRHPRHATLARQHISQDDRFTVREAVVH